VADRITDPHEGLADLEPDLDLTELAGEITRGVEGGDSPLRSAAQALRGSPADAEADAEEADAEEADDIEEGDTDRELDTLLDDDEEPEAEGEEPEAEEGEEGEEDTEEKADGRELFIPPVAKQSKGRKDTALTIDGLPQEHYDLLKAHINRSEKLDAIESQLGEARTWQAAAEFMQHEPEATMLMLDFYDRDSEKPRQVGEAFVKRWISMYPKRAREALANNKVLTGAVDDETLEDKAELARMKAQEAIDKGVKGYQVNTRQKQFASDVGAQIRTIGQQLRLDQEEMSDFATAASQRVSRAVAQRQRAGQGWPSEQEILSIIQPVAKRYLGATNGRKGKGAPGDLALLFKEKEQKRAKHRKVSGRDSSPRARDQRFGKIKGSKDTREAARRLRGD